MSYRGVQAVMLALVLVLAGCSTGGGPAEGGDGVTPTVTATPVPPKATPTEAVPTVSDPATATPTAAGPATPTPEAPGTPAYAVPDDAPAVTSEPWFDMRRTSYYEFRVTIGETVQHLALDVTRMNQLGTAYEARIEEADGDATVVFGEAAASLPDELDTFRVMQVREGPMPRSIAQLSVLTPLALARVGDTPALDSGLTPGTRAGVLDDGTAYTVTVRGQRTIGGVACHDATFTTDDGTRFETCLTGTGYAPYVSVDTGDGELTVELLEYSHEG